MEKLVSDSNLEDQLEKAVKVLQDGGLVAFPTETVYGLGADASNGKAVSLVYKVKRRPKNHPLIVHLKDKDSIYEWVSDFPSYFENLVDP